MTQHTITATLFDHVADPVDAIAHFRRRLGFEADVSDVLIDTRNDEAWAQGHVTCAC